MWLPVPLRNWLQTFFVVVVSPTCAEPHGSFKTPNPSREPGLGAIAPPDRKEPVSLLMVENFLHSPRVTREAQRKEMGGGREARLDDLRDAFSSKLTHW